MEGHVIEYMACISLAGMKRRMTLIMVVALAGTMLTNIGMMMISAVKPMVVVEVLFFGTVIEPKRVWLRSTSFVCVVD